MSGWKPHTRKDITGNRYVRLVAVLRVNPDEPKAKWLFKCDCGKEIVRLRGAVTAGNTKSCGCLNLDVLVSRSTKHGFSAQGNKHPLYDTWDRMWRRCIDPKATGYENYGGRGITVDPAWEDFAKFLVDMGPRPKGFTIERRHNDQGYSPGNCYWADRTTQARNRRSTVTLTYKGVTKPLATWAEETGISYYTLRGRKRSGYSDERCLEQPVKGSRTNEEQHV